MKPLIETIQIISSTPWSKFNDYEMEIVGMVNGCKLSMHALLISNEKKAVLKSTKEAKGYLRFERYNEIKKLAEHTSYQLLNLSGANYRVIGKVLKIEGDNILLNSKFPMMVSLIYSPIHSNNFTTKISPGDIISIDGIFKVDFDVINK